ncbi:MAG: hypothetical protein Q4B50_00160 [Bacillota bacterium]|nr:hypothetical protein [Bacillota bacterium]
MRVFFRALLPPFLLLLAGLWALALLLQGEWQLDLRLPFWLWLAALPLCAGCSLGSAWPELWRRASLLNGGFWLLLPALLLLFYKIHLPWLLLLLSGAAAVLLSVLGAWLGLGFALARAELKKEEPD